MADAELPQQALQEARVSKRALTETNDIAGVLTVLQTPFTVDDEIDFDVLHAEIGWVDEQGVDGVVVGMVSEFLRLSSEERDALAVAVCEGARERGLASVISVGAESTHTAVRHAVAAQQAGATGLMAIPPVTTALGEGEVIGYFQGILDATSIPLVVQDASGYVGRAMSIDAQKRLFDLAPDRVMFKPEANPVGPLMSALIGATDGEARCFDGSGGKTLVESFRRGAAGTMPGAEVVWAIVRLWSCLQRSDFDAAYRIHRALVPLLTMQVSLDSYLAVEKYLLKRQGVIPEKFQRGPVGFSLDAVSEREIDGLVEVLMVECQLVSDR